MRGVGPDRLSPVSRHRQAPPDSRVEQLLDGEGLGPVAAMDEVGRGAWAGPVSVGLVVMAAGVEPPDGVRDSKLLTEARREELFPLIASWCLEWSVGHASAGECDTLGMTAALRLASHRALAGIGTVPGTILLDGPHDYVSSSAAVEERSARSPGSRVPPDRALRVPEDCALRVPAVRTVVGGDATSVSIAAASVLAKVVRDRLMRSWAQSFPPFDFDRNKGYPTAAHRRALAGHGLTSLHRRSWSYVDQLAFR